MKRLISFALIGLVMAACKSRDASLVTPAKTTVTPNIVVTPIKEGATGEAQVYLPPKVDILFVIDDSASMNLYIDLMKANIHRLVESLGQAKSLDVRIAVTQIWDRTRYTTGKVPPVCIDENGKNHRNYISDGAALPLKLPNGTEDQSRNFVSTTDTDATGILESSILIPVQDPKTFTSPDGVKCESGPMVEDVFSPIRASLTSEYNKNFWRADSLKVFMVLSDAKDASNISAKSLDNYIRKQLGVVDQYGRPLQGHQDAYRVYIAGSKPGTRVDKDARPGVTKVDLNHCRPDYGFQDQKTKAWPASVPQHELAKLADLSNGEMFSICDPNYGDELAKFGDDIKSVALKNKHINLNFPVDVNPKLPPDKQFKLKLGTEELTQGVLDVDRATGTELIASINPETGAKLDKKADWAYDNVHDQVVVRGDFWNDHPNAAITVVYVPVK